MSPSDVAELFTGYIYTGDVDPRPAGGLRTILRQTAADHRLRPDEMFSASRDRRITRPRQDFMWRARQILRADGSHRYSLPHIAAFLGKKDHTTVLHGARQHQKRRANYCDPMAAK